MAQGLFILSYMLARMAGPIAQDWYETHTSHGRKMAQKREQERLDLEQRELERRLNINDNEHQNRMKELRFQFELKKQDGERQLLLAQSDWNQKNFIQNCWPLRNSFDVPIGISPVYDDNREIIKKWQLRTVISANHLEIAPLRVISALKNNEFSYAPTINSELSLFLMRYFSANGEHAVLSDIGSWKADAPVNDATVNYLFMGLQGQPVVVIAPEHTNDGTIIRFKLWSWGLGEQLSYPVGFEVGWLDISALYRHILSNEVKALWESTKSLNIGGLSREMERDMAILEQIDKAENPSAQDIERCLTLLSTPKEVATAVRKATNSVLSEVFCCITGMYADTYHLTTYGTIPVLPSILNHFNSVGFFLPVIRDYYLSIINACFIKAEVNPLFGSLTIEEAIKLEFSLLDAFIIGKATEQECKQLAQSIQSTLFQMDDDVPSKRLYLKQLKDYENKFKLIK